MSEVVMRHITKEGVRNASLCAVGSIIYCVGVNLFISPSGLYSGGFVGISQLLTLLFQKTPLASFNIQGILYFLLNVPLFILGFVKLGKKLIGKTVAIIVFESFLMSVIPIPKVMLLDEITSNAIAGGILCGLGEALLFIGFGSSGGTDILGLIVSKNNKNFSVGKVSIAINFCVYVISAFLFNLNVAVYSFAASLFSSIVIDKLHIQNRAVSVNIMSGQLPTT